MEGKPVTLDRLVDLLNPGLRAAHMSAPDVDEGLIMAMALISQLGGWTLGARNAFIERHAGDYAQWRRQIDARSS